MSDASLPSEQSGAIEQSGTPAFPIIVSATPTEPPAATELAVQDPSEAFALASELTRDQQRVLQQLALGVSISQASRTARVPRRNITRWVNHDPKFIAALNAWKNEQLESGRASAFAMTDVVMGTLRTGVEKGNTAIAFRMADKMGFLGSNPGPIDIDEVERRRKIRGARVEDELSQAESRFDLDLHDRAEREEIAWSERALRRLSYDEQSLLNFLRDKAAGRTNATLIHHSKRQMFDMLLKGGVKEDEALQLLANYRRPYPGFCEPHDLSYAEDEQKGEAPVADAAEQITEAKAEETGSQDAPPGTASEASAPPTNA
jgi:hypothetical protein